MLLTVVLEKHQPWIFIGGTDAKAEALVLWPPDAKSWLIGRDPDAGKDWRREEKGMTEDEIVWWHHLLKGHKFEQTLGDGKGQGSLMWGRKELDTTERLNNNNGFLQLYMFSFSIILWPAMVFLKPWLHTSHLKSFKSCWCLDPTLRDLVCLVLDAAWTWSVLKYSPRRLYCAAKVEIKLM